MKTIGTILPTRDSILANERYASAVAAKKKAVGATIANARRRLVGGEVRWYTSDSAFAVVNAAGKVRWFEVRENGDVYAKR
jgi:hypothetical protein